MTFVRGLGQIPQIQVLTPVNVRNAEKLSFHSEVGRYELVTTVYLAANLNVFDPC